VEGPATLRANFLPDRGPHDLQAADFCCGDRAGIEFGAAATSVERWIDMSFFDRAKQVAGQATGRAKEEIAEVQTRLELDKAYEQLGKTTFGLIDTGELTHEQLAATVDRIRALRAKLSDKPSP
jgi:hypothetical protein